MSAICKLRCIKQKSQPLRLTRLSLFHSLIGRDGVIRTHDPLHPMQVRYQAALRPELYDKRYNKAHIITQKIIAFKRASRNK